MVQFLPTIIINGGPDHRNVAYLTDLKNPNGSKVFFLGFDGYDAHGPKEERNILVPGSPLANPGLEYSKLPRGEVPNFSLCENISQPSQRTACDEIVFDLHIHGEQRHLSNYQHDSLRTFLNEKIDEDDHYKPAVNLLNDLHRLIGEIEIATVSFDFFVDKFAELQNQNK